MTQSQIKPALLHTLHDAVQQWYSLHGRHALPWRNTPDAYAIWVSEVMLQQTQVSTVLSRYYTPFLEQFPSIESLANASRDTLMKAWEGLGYYRRAAHMHLAAQECKKFGYTLPTDIEQLLLLPGIGRNTAHAIAAFAYHQPAAVMEANVKRIICRFFALQSPSEADLWHYAELLLNRKQPYNHNQAMMDIGALVCTKSSPNCLSCPLSRGCKGKHAPEDYPQPRTKRATPVRERVIIVWRNAQGHAHVTKRTGAFLHGLYGFDEYEQPPDSVHIIGRIEQVYSHFILRAEVGVGEYAGHNSGEYMPLSAVKALPLSRADAKVLGLLQSYLDTGGNTRRKKK